ncbi:MAG: ATP-binding protein, partial [Gammaproteobacteria bacterium]
VQAVGNHGRITLRTRSERQFTLGPRRYRLVLRLDVIDDGPGIPSDLQEHVFYPLVTGRSTGTGLGLSIAQSLVHLHGGLIEFSSKPGETIFTTWLPLMRDVN